MVGSGFVADSRVNLVLSLVESVGDIKEGDALSANCANFVLEKQRKESTYLSCWLMSWSENGMRQGGEGDGDCACDEDGRKRTVTDVSEDEGGKVHRTVKEMKNWTKRKKRIPVHHEARA